jgi:hypothetical protein
MSCLGHLFWFRELTGVVFAPQRALKTEFDEWEGRRAELHERQRGNAEVAGTQQTNIEAGLRE